MLKVRTLLVFVLLSSFVIVTAFISGHDDDYTIDQLRELYSSGQPQSWPKANVDAGPAKNFKDIGKPGAVKFPKNNPFSKEKMLLGKMLFFDPRLSLSRQIACASCHDPELGWGDGKHLAYGHNRQNGKRNSMTILNTGYYDRLFWDGRASSLEDQVQFPVQDQAEMAQGLKAMVRNVKNIKGYRVYFEAAFGMKEVSLDAIQKAIATFKRTVTSKNSRFDLFVDGNKTILKDDEVMGLHLFRTKARCINCHNTPLFSDNQFHNDGQALYGSKQEDFGHYHLSGKQEDVGAFRTPSLRETKLTGPWMHHGNFPTLRDVVEYYNGGNPSPIQRSVKVDEAKRPIPSPLLRKLNLTKEERLQLEAFLGAISTQVQKIQAPELPK